MTTTHYVTTLGENYATRSSDTMAYTHATWAWKIDQAGSPQVHRWHTAEGTAHTFARAMARQGWQTAVQPVKIDTTRRTRRTQAAQVVAIPTPEEALADARVARRDAIAHLTGTVDAAWPTLERILAGAVAANPGDYDVAAVARWFAQDVPAYLAADKAFQAALSSARRV
jgi:hypothetical protein